MPAIHTPSLLEDIRILLFGGATRERNREARPRRPKAGSVQHAPAAAKEFHHAIKKGMPVTVLSRLKEHTHLSDEELARILGMSRKTLQRRRHEKDQVLTASEGDRAYRVARVFAFAKALFGSNEAASKWLREPQVGLGRDIPLDLMLTEAGALEVEDYLGRMAHGVVS
jgi:putative toxin-antitoxin system antitoxin component (TIGR02293 family)